MSELNPHHPVTESMRDQWHKIAALLMRKLGQTHVIITEADIADIGEADVCVIIHDKADGIHVRLVGRAEGERLAREHGGLAN